jgi:putative component of membrane protein insertase Oxa1/YidC/SpoIIIJ protein YidD
MIQAINGYGVWRGLGKGLWRLLRCQPFAKGGYDPVTPKREFKVQNANCKVQSEAEGTSAFSASSAVRIGR